MILGPDLTETIAHAKQLVIDNLVRLAEADGTPPTLRAMYVRKCSEAQLVLAGGQSYLIESEAQIRGIDKEEMARTILAMAAQAGDALEVYRMQINVAIEAAGSEDEIFAILASLGIAFEMALPDAA